MTTIQKFALWAIAFLLGAIVPLVSISWIDKCSPIGDANFWLPFVSISCPAELLGQVGCFVVGFVFTIVFFVVMAAQLLLLGAAENAGILSLDFIGSIGNFILIIPLFAALSTNVLFYCVMLRGLFLMVSSGKIKPFEM